VLVGYVKIHTSCSEDSVIHGAAFEILIVCCQSFLSRYVRFLHIADSKGNVQALLQTRVYGILVGALRPQAQDCYVMTYNWHDYIISN